MSFSVPTTISSCADFKTFLADWSVGENDLIITNSYVLQPQLGNTSCPCDVLFQEQFGSGEPNDQMVDAMLAAADKKEYNRIIAMGGGTVIDIAKLFVFGSGLRCEEIFAKGATLERKRGLVILPTTCGTGSEVTNISIIEFKEKKTKMGLAVPALFADEAVMISPLLATLPYEVFATSSIDALIHAVESFASPRANVFTQAMSRTAIDMLLAGYRKCAEGAPRTLPEDMESFLAASTMAGIAFGNAGCAAVHALSYPIGAIYHVPHGKANYLMFEGVFKAYRQRGADLSALEAVLAHALGCAVADVWQELFSLLDQILSRQPLRELGVDDTVAQSMAASVVQNQQRLLKNNPIALSEADILEIYRGCL